MIGAVTGANDKCQFTVAAFRLHQHEPVRHEAMQGQQQDKK